MSSLNSDSLVNLVNLAQDKSDAARKMLVENISDLFLSAEGRLNEHERVLMNDILGKLIKNVEKNVRQALSERLAASNSLSEDLADFLARDDIDIARPILEKSNVLRDESLMEIIRNRTDEHRLAIAIREHISTDVSAELVEFGSEDVIEALLKNEDAELSQTTMEYLVNESRRVDRFQEPLLGRHDLPTALAHRMYWWVSAAFRRKILMEFDIDEAMLDDALELSSNVALAKKSTEDNAEASARKLVIRMALRGQLTAEFLLQSLRQQKILVAVTGLAELAGLDNKIILRAFREKSGESLAVICKAIDIDRSDFTSLFLLISQASSGGGGRATHILKQTLALYDEIKTQNAISAIRHWQRDIGFQEAVSDIMKAG